MCLVVWSTQRLARLEPYHRTLVDRTLLPLRARTVRVSYPYVWTCFMPPGSMVGLAAGNLARRGDLADLLESFRASLREGTNGCGVM